jgi:hypothetical protein
MRSKHFPLSEIQSPWGMKVGDSVSVCCSINTSSFRGVAPFFVANRSTGHGTVVGFAGYGNDDYVLVKVAGVTGVYLPSEIQFGKQKDGDQYLQILPSTLDDAVHQECSAMASSINNEGRMSQLSFLRSRGYKHEDFIKLVPIKKEK